MRSRIKYRLIPILDDLKCFVKKNLFFIILFAVFYIVGIIVGVSIAVKTEDAKASLMVVNWLIGSYALKNMNLFLFFLLRILFIFVIVLIFALASYKIFLSIAYLVVFVYLGITCGGAIVLLFMIFGFASLIIDILGFVIFELVSVSYFAFFAAHMFAVAVENHRFGCNHTFLQLIKPCVQQFIFLAAMVIVQTVLLFFCAVFVL